MSNRKIRVQQLRVNSQLQKQSERSSRNSFLPAINNENYLHNHHDSKNSINFYQTAQAKRNGLVLTTKNHENNQNFDFDGMIKLLGETKRCIRPLAVIDKSLIKTSVDRKNDPIQEKKLIITQQNKPSIQTVRAKSIELSAYPSQSKSKQPTPEGLPIEKSKRKSNRLLFRDRTNSCKVATKRSLFPFSEKHRQAFRIGEYFEQQFQKLSTIGGQSEHGSSKFISLDSFSELIA